MIIVTNFSFKKYNLSGCKMPGVNHVFSTDHVLCCLELFGGGGVILGNQDKYESISFFI